MGRKQNSGLWVVKILLDGSMLITSLVAQMVKSLPVIQETRVWSLGQEDALEKEMATHSSILAWEIPWTRSLVDYSPWGHKESDMTEWLTQAMLITKWLSPLVPFYTLLCQADAWMLQSTFSLVSLVLPEWARDMLLPLCLLFLSSEPICCFCNHLPD